MEEKEVLQESHLRSLLKTLSWRIIATATTVTIAFFVFGDISSALKVGGIEFFAKMVIYYGHERAWQLIPRGTIRKMVKKK
jgi:uncharacterized membrane protein